MLLFLASPLFGQSSEDKKFAVRTSIFAHALTYNLDKQNGVGFHFGQLSTKINQDKGTSKNWILINFIEKPFFNQFMSVFAMKF